MPESAGIPAPPPLQGPCPGVMLTLGLQLSEVTQDGAEGWPLGWLIGQALAGECGQLWARGLRQLVLLLVEALFLLERGPEGVSVHPQSPSPRGRVKSPEQGWTSQVLVLVIPILQMRPLSLGNGMQTCPPPQSQDWNPSRADCAVLEHLTLGPSCPDFHAPLLPGRFCILQLPECPKASRPLHRLCPPPRLLFLAWDTVLFPH